MTIAELQEEIEKKHGQFIFGTRIANYFTYIETNNFPLDFATLGGLPEGQLSLFVGWESSGKTTSALKCVAAFQEKYPDKSVAYADFEGAIDMAWAEQLGVDLDRLYLIQPTSGEMGIDIMIAAIQESEIGMLVIDSIAMVGSEKQINASASDNTVGERARLMEKFWVSWCAINTERRNNQDPLTTLGINQYRHKIGVMYGDNTSIPGGNGQKFHAALLVRFALKKEIMGKDKHDIDIVTYNEHTFRIKKSKVGNSVREGEFKLYRDPNGDLEPGDIDDYATVIGYGKKYGFITGGGATWKLMNNEQRFKNKDDIRKYLIDNPLDYKDLKAHIIASRRIELRLPALPKDNYLMRYHGTETLSLQKPANSEAISNVEDEDLKEMVEENVEGVEED